MLGGAFAAEQVASRLERLRAEQPGIPIVFDPVMVATSGAPGGPDMRYACGTRPAEIARWSCATTRAWPPSSLQTDTETS